jgi:hypothetical protein
VIAVPRRVRQHAAACCLAAFAALAACRPGAQDVAVTWAIEPTPPTAGTATIVRVGLRRDGRPAAGASLSLEAHMSHPGMTPATARLEERAPGSYEAQVQLTMAGDWVFVVRGSLADGSRVSSETRVPSVRPAQ